MKTRGLATIVATIVITVLALASSGMAQEVCTPEMAKGRYLVTCSGSVSLLPFAAQGVFTNEVVGGTIQSSGKFLESLNGAQFEADYVSSSVELRPDCTGTVVYTVTVGGQDQPEVHLEVVALDQGKELRSFNTVEGVVSLCTAKLMSRSTNQGQAE